MTGASEWTGRVGGTWVREWERTDRSFGSLTAHLLDPAAIGDITSALDIGCGAGEVAITLAARNPAAEITGLDISQDLLSVARERGSTFGNLTFREGDAARWKPDDNSNAPDFLISRHGVMFFDDPPAAFANIRRALKPDGRLVETYAYGEVGAQEATDFYRAVMPEFGWRNIDGLVFTREGEMLRIELIPEEHALVVRFVLSPKSLQ